SLDGAALAALWQEHTRDGLPGRSLRSRDLLPWSRQQAQASEKEGDRFGAAWHLGRLIEAAPGDRDLLLRRARAYAWLGAAPAALADLDRAGGEAGPGADLYWLRGRVLAQLGRLDQALAELNEAVKREPDDPAFRFFRGLVQMRRGAPAEGERDFSA